MTSSQTPHRSSTIQEVRNIGHHWCFDGWSTRWTEVKQPKERARRPFEAQKCLFRQESHVSRQFHQQQHWQRIFYILGASGTFTSRVFRGNKTEENSNSSNWWQQRSRKQNSADRPRMTKLNLCKERGHQGEQSLLNFHRKTPTEKEDTTIWVKEVAKVQKYCSQWCEWPHRKRPVGLQQYRRFGTSDWCANT